MRSLTTIIALAIMFGTGGALLAQATAPADKTADPGNRVVCKYSQRTGTRFKTKTCHTVAQWEEMSEESKRAAAEQINRPVVDVSRGN